MRPRRLLGFVAVLAAVAAFGPGAASASQLIDRDVRGVRLQVNARGEALLTYTKGAKRMNVLAWGAVNAVAPTKSRPQVEFELDYAGGWGKYRRTVTRAFANSCGAYTGPPLAWFVTACTAPDGSHWAVQSWQRMLPNYGVAPTRKGQASWELRLSHWTGELPVLTVNVNWAYRTFDHIFGSFTYQGRPVHGFASTPQGNPLDSYGRNLYVDTLNSAYGRGWKRENSFLMHKPTGVFCYGFYRHGAHPAGNGERYRATIIGPGVTPDVMWQGLPLGTYERAKDLELHDRQKAFYAGDPLCRPV